VAQADKEVRDDAQASSLEMWTRKATLQVLRAEAETLLREAVTGPEK
jgi:hypothetical protein